MSKQDGGPAFPIIIPDAQIHFQGMSLRDYFAAKAMESIITKKSSWFGKITYEQAVAIDAYLQADAMLKEREKSV